MKRTGLSLGILLMATLLFACAPKTEKQALPEALTKEEPALAKEAWELAWEKTVAAAKKEKKVILYLSGGITTVKALADVMREKFGIELEYVIGKGSQVSAKVLAERNAGLFLFDIFVSGFSTLTERLHPARGLDPIEPALILPEVKDPSKWWGGQLPFINEERTGITFTGVVQQPVLYNTNLVKRGAITSYRDLLKPEWKDKIVYYDPTVSGGGNTFFTVISVEILSLDFFKELAKQNPVIITDNRLVVEWVARGKYAIALGASQEEIAEFKSAGAPLDELTPKEGTYISSSGGNIGLINRAPHPNAAKVFINFLLSREGQDIWAVNDGVQSLRVDATTKHLKPEGVRQPGVKYIVSDKGKVRERRDEHRELAREIFAPFMRAR